MELYVLRLDMYYEWALECGACELIGVYDDKSKAVKDLKHFINAEIEDGRRVDYLHEDIDAFENNDENSYYVDIYEDDCDYDNGKSMGTFVIEKKILNENGTII